MVSRNTNLEPEFLIQGTGNQAAFKQYDRSAVWAAVDLHVKVIVPVSQLSLLQWLHVKIRTADLSGNERSILQEFEANEK